MEMITSLVNAHAEINWLCLLRTTLSDELWVIHSLLGKHRSLYTRLEREVNLCDLIPRFLVLCYDVDITTSTEALGEKLD